MSTKNDRGVLLIRSTYWAVILALYVVLTIIAIALLLYGLLDQNYTLKLVLAGPVGMLLFGWLAIRTIHAGIYTSAKGITAISDAGSKHLAWGEVRSFRASPGHRLYGRINATLLNGDTTTFTIAGAAVSLSQLEHAAAQLNQELARRR